MAKTVVAAMTAGFLLLLSVGTPAYATPVTVDFYVRVDSVTPLDPALREYVPWSLPYVGQRFFAGAFYDDANVPSSGTYTIGHFEPGMDVSPPADELQAGASVSLSSPIGVPIELYPNAFSSGMMILLVDGRFSGVICLDSVDTYSLNWQGYEGMKYSANGWYVYPAPDPPPDFNILIEEQWSVSGTLHVVPDPGSTLLLLGIGLAGLTARQRRWQ